MKILIGNEAAEAAWHMSGTAKTASRATCLRGKCGAHIVKDGEVIGRGYNSPPQDDERNRKCHKVTSLSPNPRHDQTCCTHAEWRAIHDALRCNPDKIVGAILYFARIDDSGAIKFSGQPYCTVCSRLALDVRISHFVLWHEDGITSYDTEEYNDLSYDYERPAW